MHCPPLQRWLLFKTQRSNKVLLTWLSDKNQLCYPIYQKTVANEGTDRRLCCFTRFCPHQAQTRTLFLCFFLCNEGFPQVGFCLKKYAGISLFTPLLLWYVWLPSSVRSLRVVTKTSSDPQPLHAVLPLGGLTVHCKVPTVLQEAAGSLVVPDSSGEQWVGSHPTRVQVVFAKDNLPQIWFYTVCFFPLHWPQPKNNGMSRCCPGNGGVWKRMHTCTDVCKHGTSCEPSVLFHYMNSSN